MRWKGWGWPSRRREVEATNDRPVVDSDSNGQGRKGNQPGIKAVAVEIYRFPFSVLIWCEAKWVVEGRDVASIMNDYDLESLYSGTGVSSQW